MNSMTGFGRGESVSADGALKVNTEVATVNRKQLEIRISLPREVNFLEPLARKIIRKKLRRGVVNLRVMLTFGDDLSSSAVRINEGFITAVLSRSAELSEKFSLPRSLELKDVLALPGAIEDVQPELDQNLMETLLSEALTHALDEVVLMRSDEGLMIKEDVIGRLKLIKENVLKVKEFAPLIPLQQREKLLRRLEEANLPLAFDDERIMRELVIYSDRADVSEELTRLESHFEQFERYMNYQDRAVGRSIDFIIQEMNREITTLGNKSGNSNISPLVVEMKTELEKIREQIQNIE